MKTHKWNLMAAFSYLAACGCFVFAAIKQTEQILMVLDSVAAGLFLVGSVLFFCIYHRYQKEL